MVNSKNNLRSGEVARQVGISPDTLRLYERKGLLSPLRLPNGYRCYSPNTLTRVRVIRAALLIGFTLDELAEILKVRDSGGQPCLRVRELAETKMHALRQQIEQLTSLREHLREVLEDWDRQIKRTPAHKPAGLLEQLASATGNARALPPHVYAALAKETAK